MKAKIILFLILFFLSYILFAEEPAVYVIEQIDFDIVGRTKPFALLIASGINTGDKITGTENLEAYIKEKTQALLNQRQLESAEIIYDVINEISAGENTAVKLTIKTIDTNNRIILPYPKFSSSSGTKLELRYRDYNSFGMLSTFRVNLGYARDSSGNNYANAVLGFGSPFEFLGLLWNFDFDNQFSWRINNENAPFFYKNASFLSAEIPAGNTAFEAGIRQKAGIKEEELFDYDYELSPFEYLVDSSLNIFDYHEHLNTYITENAFAAWKIPLGSFIFRTEGGAKFTFFPEGQTQFDYYKKGPAAVLKNSFYFSKIDWLGNFQKGVKFVVENNNEFNFDDSEKNAHDLSAQLTAHIPLARFLGLSLRASYQKALSYHYIAIGGPLRGIPDKDYSNDEYNLTASDFAFLNVDFQISVFTFFADKVFKNDKLKIANFELQIAPIIDAALYRDQKKDDAFKWLLSSGAEIKVFPLKFRSFFLRLSCAVDILKITGSPEIYIGIGNHY